MLKKASLYLIALFFVSAGIVHFVLAESFAMITPLPYAIEIVWLTGVMELFFALFILLPRYRSVSGLWLCIYCLAVLPANINMAINDIAMFGEPVSPVILWLRIPLQFVLIAWILYASDGWRHWQHHGVRAFYRCRMSPGPDH